VFSVAGHILNKKRLKIFNVAQPYSLHNVTAAVIFPIPTELESTVALHYVPTVLP